MLLAGGGRRLDACEGVKTLADLTPNRRRVVLTLWPAASVLKMEVLHDPNRKP